MTITCSVCRSREVKRCLELLGMDICRKCAGLLTQRIIGYIRDFDKEHPPLKRPKPGRPIVDAHGQRRCRTCERQIETGSECSDCAASATPFPASQSERASCT